MQLRGGQFQFLQCFTYESAFLAGLHEDDDLVTGMCLKEGEEEARLKLFSGEDVVLDESTYRFLTLKSRKLHEVQFDVQQLLESLTFKVLINCGSGQKRLSQTGHCLDDALHIGQQLFLEESISLIQD